jgi:hypothetical protein
MIDMQKLCGKAEKRPVEINYFIWQTYSVPNLKELMSWVESFGDKFHEHMEFSLGRGNLRVHTLEGTSYVIPDGYVIIRGIKGEYYPCEPDIFEQTYKTE